MAEVRLQALVNRHPISRSPTIQSLDSARRVGASRWRRRNHQAQPLQQHDGALRCSAPNQLATFTLTVLDVNVSARILQAAVLKRAIYEHPLIKNHVLILEDLVLMSIHDVTQTLGREGRAAVFVILPPWGTGSAWFASKTWWRKEAIIHLPRMQAGRGSGSGSVCCPLTFLLAPAASGHRHHRGRTG